MIKDLSTWLWTLAICMIPPVGLFILGVYESRHEKHKRRQLWCVDDVDNTINKMHPMGGEVHKTLDVVFTKEDGLQFTPDQQVILWRLEDSDGVYTITHGSVHKKICASANVLRITKKPTTVENYGRFAWEPIELVRVERFVVTADECHLRTVDVLYWQFANENTRKRYEQLSQIDDTIAELCNIRQTVINRKMGGDNNER